MEKLRMAIIGTGGMGSAHAGFVQNIEEVKLCAVSDARPDAAGKLGEKYSIPAYGDYREMLKNEKPDFVLIAVPHPAHMKVALDAFAAGAHVLCEKPLASNLIEADRIVEAAEKRRKLLGVMFQQRTEPAKRKLHEIVNSGMLGELTRVTMVSSCYRSQAYYNSGAWRGSWAGEGGGVLLNQAPHDLDQFIWIGGVPVEVQGFVETTPLHDIEVEDSATALVKYANGARGSIHVSTVEHPSTYHFEICGDRGKAVFDGAAIKLWLVQPGISEFTRTSTIGWSFPEVTEQAVEIPIQPAAAGAAPLTTHAVLTRDFANAIMENRQPLAPGREGLWSLELANAIIYSSHRKKPVNLPLSRQAYNSFFKDKCKTSRYKG